MLPSWFPPVYIRPPLWMPEYETLPPQGTT